MFSPMNQFQDRKNNQTVLDPQEVTISKSQCPIPTEENINYQYFQYMLNVMKLRKEIQRKIEELNQKRNSIFQKVVYYSKKTEEEFKDCIRGEAPQRKKRNRRNADQIQRQYPCNYCSKKYGSEGSLQQHIKIKHSDFRCRKIGEKNNLQLFEDQSKS